LDIGNIYPGTLQQYYLPSLPSTSSKIWKDNFNLNNQDLVLSIHMQYFISNFREASCNPEKEWIEALCWMYARLAPGGKLFVVGASGDGSIPREKFFKNNGFIKLIRLGVKIIPRLLMSVKNY